MLRSGKSEYASYFDNDNSYSLQWNVLVNPVADEDRYNERLPLVQDFLGNNACMSLQELSHDWQTRHVDLDSMSYVSRPHDDHGELNDCRLAPKKEDSVSSEYHTI